VTDHDRRVSLLVIWLAILVGALAVAELVYLAVLIWL
jgi:hypothetical protein